MENQVNLFYIRDLTLLVLFGIYRYSSLFMQPKQKIISYLLKLTEIIIVFLLKGCHKKIIIVIIQKVYRLTPLV